MTLRIRLILAFLLVTLAPLALLAWSVGPILEQVRARGVEASALEARPLLTAEPEQRALKRQMLAWRESLSKAAASSALELQDLLSENTGSFARKRRESATGIVRELAQAQGLQRFMVSDRSRGVYQWPDGAPPTLPLSGDEDSVAWRWSPDQEALVLSASLAWEISPADDRTLLLLAERTIPAQDLADSLSRATALPVYVTGRLPGQPVPEPAGPQEVVVELLSRGGAVVGVIRADLSHVGLTWMAPLRVSLLQAVIVGAGLALALALVFASLLTRPLRRLTKAVEEVADHPGEPASMPGGGGEVGSLAAAVDRMLAGLRREQQRRTRAERTAAWQEVARRVAHEVRNPLTPIRLGVDNLRRARRKSPQVLDGCLEEEAVAILEEVGRLERLVSEFSQFARLPHARPRPVNLAALVRQAVSGQTEGVHGLEVSFELDAIDGDFLVDPDLCSMALANLARNAAQSMGGERGELLVTTARITGDRQQGLLEIRLEDTGPGIDEELLEHLFEPYVTGRGPAGTGLGLTLVRQVIREHGGSIDASNRDGGGAVFRILLPIEREA